MHVLHISPILKGECVQELGVPRTDYVLATKLFRGGSEANSTGLNRKHIIEGTQVGLLALDLFWVLFVSDVYGLYHVLNHYSIFEVTSALCYTVASWMLRGHNSQCLSDRRSTQYTAD